MTVLDTESGEVIATETGLVFCSNGDGTLTVVEESSPGTFKVVETVVTQNGTRTITIDPKTHNVYLPTAQFGPPPAPSAEVPRPRRTIIGDSFVILVVGK